MGMGLGEGERRVEGSAMERMIRSGLGAVKYFIA